MYASLLTRLQTPIEVTMRALKELVDEGKIRHIGLSECSGAILERAVKIHPVAACQMEYSPWSLEIESDQTNFLKTARKLGVAIGSPHFPTLT